MTGYGRGEAQQDDKQVVVEVKSFNHRFLDVVLHLPRRLTPLEARVRSLVRQRLSRGRIEVSVQVEDSALGGERLEVDLAVARDYYQALKTLAEDLGLPGEIRLETLAAFRDIFLRKEQPLDLEKEWAFVQESLQKALENLERMRGEEGLALGDDFGGRLGMIDGMVREIEERNAQALPGYRDRLGERVRNLCEGLPLDPARLTQEMAYLAERSDITEELVRIKSHLGRFRQMLDDAEPTGRKLEFLLQEMNREANTIGSKAIDAAVAQVVVQIKSELEKMREQLQNVE